MTTRDCFITFAPLIALLALMLAAFGTAHIKDDHRKGPRPPPNA